jgi:TatD DNase family protein
MQLIDTHCHIHSVDYPIPITEVDAHNAEAGVDYLVCVGCDAADSERAVQFVADRPNSWATVGQHPHEAKYGMDPLEKLRGLIIQERASRRSATSELSTVLGERQNVAEKPVHSKIVGVGECGLDYFYGHSTKEEQEEALRYQIELALEFDLPLVFHVREAFDDFWPIFDSYEGIRGVLHSFTDSSTNLSKAITRGLYIGVNGIMTFTKNDAQLEVARQIPLNRLVLETDAPFLTPVPLRGKVNEPARVLLVAQFLSELRQISLQEVAQHTTTNARQLFSI